MNRFVRGAVAAALVAGGLGSAGCAGTGGAVARGTAPDGRPYGGNCAGCDGGGPGLTKGHGDGAIYRTLVDTCYPERYNAAARDEVLDPFRKQVNNGNVMHQTVWNFMFEPGTDRLTPAGYEKLDSLARVRPYPDCKILLQTARDLPATPDTLDKLPAAREELDAKRAASVQRYMASQPTFHPTVYEVYLHDPVVPGIDANFGSGSYRGQQTGYRGGIGGGSGTAVTATGGGGPAPPASSIGTGSGGTGAGGSTPGGSAVGPPR